MFHPQGWGSITSAEIIDVPDRLITGRFAPAFVRSDNEPEFIVTVVRKYLGDLVVVTRLIKPGASWKTVASKALTVLSGTSS
jgi:hypothetical protein